MADPDAELSCPRIGAFFRLTSLLPKAGWGIERGERRKRCRAPRVDDSLEEKTTHNQIGFVPYSEREEEGWVVLTLGGVIARTRVHEVRGNERLGLEEHPNGARPKHLVACRDAKVEARSRPGVSVGINQASGAVANST